MKTGNKIANNKLETPLDSKVQPIVNELTGMANMIRVGIQESILRNTGVLTPNNRMEENTFQNEIKQEVLEQMERFGTVKATMFICPRVDVRDMRNPSMLYPTSISISSVDGRRADIFTSRIPRIFQLFQQIAAQDVNFELVLIMGDSDFAPNIGYQWKAIEYAVQQGGEMGVFDENIFMARTKSYKNYLAELLRTNSKQNDIPLFEVVTDAAPKTSQRTIRILSFYELYKLGAVPSSSDTDLNHLALEEEAAAKLSHFREAVNKYDTSFFGRVTPEQVGKITEAKFQSYRDQGLYVAQNHGRILLSDELPPVLKSEMYRNKLLMLWPWIRKEDPERNPSFVSEKTHKVTLVEPELEG